MLNPPSPAEHAFSSASRHAQGDDAVWRDHFFLWKELHSWVPHLTAWLAPHFRADAIRRLKPGQPRELCWDDHEWPDVLARCLKGRLDDHTRDLANALEHSVLRTFHGCRTDDAGHYFREGLRRHDRAEMTARLRAIVNAHEELHWMKERLDRQIEEIKNELDPGRLYVVADERRLLDDSAHYLISGSEWIMAVLGPSGWPVLQRIGAPTLIEIDLRLRACLPSDRKGLATDMLREWTRVACNGHEWSAPIHCSFCLFTDIPAAWIVGHSHPTELKDPHRAYGVYRSPNKTCKHCA
jgi:hypothetical protein